MSRDFLNSNAKKPELLAPAGDFEKLKYACAYGADAVYFGTITGSLRNFATNFSLDQIPTALDYLHQRGKKGYITLNIYPFPEQYEQLLDIAASLDPVGPDAFIVSDIGLIRELKKLNLETAIHISTQANVTSAQTALAFKQLGAKRVNLARELSLAQIEQIQRQIAGRVETEVFIHGAVCFSHSGRCAISDYLTGFRANQGQCKHPCRWKYALVEEKRPGQYFPVIEDSTGTHIFNSKELALFEYLPQFAAVGVTSFKIEGRMKSIHYVAAVTSFYRQLLDGRSFTCDQALDYLNRVPNRGYCTGFIKGSIDQGDYNFEKSYSQAASVFVANVTEQTQNGQPILQVRNRINTGDQLELLTPDGLSTVTMPNPLQTPDGQTLKVASNPTQLLAPANLPPFSILRRLKDHHCD